MTLTSDELTTWRERLGPLGVWCTTDPMRAEAAGTFAGEVEALGYGALWLPETLGRDPFAHATHLAGCTDRLILATGIANIFHRHPGPMVQATNTVAELSGGRFLLGIGVSHQPIVEGLRGLDYSKPLSTMRAYLDGMDGAPYMAPAPDAAAPRLLAALGPKMLELAAARADGVHPYFTTPEHTTLARSAIGDEKLLCVEQKVVLTEDPEVGRGTAIAALGMYADLPNYRNNWIRLGYSDSEIEARAPRFLDAVVAWGSVEAIRERIGQHHEAGADHVCIQALAPNQGFRVDRATLQALAPSAH